MPGQLVARAPESGRAVTATTGTEGSTRGVQRLEGGGQGKGKRHGPTKLSFGRIEVPVFGADLYEVPVAGGSSAFPCRNGEGPSRPIRIMVPSLNQGPHLAVVIIPSLRPDSYSWILLHPVLRPEHWLIHSIEPCLQQASRPASTLKSGIFGGN